MVRLFQKRHRRALPSLPSPPFSPCPGSRSKAAPSVLPTAPRSAWRQPVLGEDLAGSQPGECLHAEVAWTSAAPLFVLCCYNKPPRVNSFVRPELYFLRVMKSCVFKTKLLISDEGLIAGSPYSVRQGRERLCILCGRRE